VITNREIDNMALETLKGVDKINGFKVAQHYANGESFATTAVDDFVVVNHDVNEVSFKIQNGPIKEVGVNGCQVETLIECAMTMIMGLNENFPCNENHMAISKLKEASLWLQERKKDRELSRSFGRRYHALRERKKREGVID
tara:strand:+ start:7011 stop:7436 length:426 start_codon:yes stop_codon:yes gene_type:complete